MEVIDHISTNLESISDINSNVPNFSQGLRTPCNIESIPVLGLVDGGATHSCISTELVRQLKLPIIPVDGQLRQVVAGTAQPRIGRVLNVLLENGKRSILVDLEVANLDSNEKLILGLDVFSKLGFEITGVPFHQPERSDSELQVKSVKNSLSTELPPEVNAEGIHESWNEVLAANQALSSDSRCKLRNSELSLETNCKPIWTRQYPIPIGYQQSVRDQVQSWASSGTIVYAPDGCQWNHPLLPVPKPNKDGGSSSVRTCLDLRRINDQLLNIPDCNLPNIREIQDSIGNFEYITVIDLADSYNQFAIRSEDQQKTAFTYDGVHWMFTAVPFGIKSMSGHMQRIIEELVGPYKRHPFQDDIAVSTPFGGNHAKDVLEILEVLTYKAGLRLRLSKCKFYQTSARVLGSMITRTGIQMDPLKIKAILNWTQPIDGKGLQRFMGSANFHRDYSHKFAVISGPLEEIKNTLGHIQWTPERIESFKAVKRLFAANIELRSFDFTKMIYLTSDACATGVGAWLGQKFESDTIEPVICVSKKLSPTQQRWSATKRELWALMWAMDKLRHYLLGRKFFARVDHKPLVAMLDNKMNPLMEGWMDTILKFDFTTIYYPGEENLLADALSRSHESTSDTEPLIRASHVDSTGPSTQTVKLDSEDMSADPAVLFEAFKRGKRLPAALERIQLIEQTHYLGHFGVDTMFKHLWNQDVWWPRIRLDLQNATNNCTPCLRFNIVKKGFHPLKSIEANQPWDHLQIDLIGPLPQSAEGYVQILTVTDVMSGYTVLRPLFSKEMEQVARALWEIFSEYGIPKVLQSDNGPEFVNQVMKMLTKLYGIDHRLITPYHPRAGGLVERKNKDVSKGLKKRMVGATDQWHYWLPQIQLSLNQIIQSRTGSTPFEIMHARPFNNFLDFSDTIVNPDVEASIDKRVQLMSTLYSTIYPAIAKRVSLMRADRNEKFNTNRAVQPPLTPGTRVMAFDQTRASKWDPIYEGPFTIQRLTDGGSYVLNDATGDEVPRRMSREMLSPIEDDKVVNSFQESGGINNQPSSTNFIDEDEHFEVEAIMDHRMSSDQHTHEYLVKWKNYNVSFNSWITAEDFDGLKMIKAYWKKSTKPHIVMPPRKSQSKKQKSAKSVKSVNTLH